jgi:phosphohistidine phosphatase
MHRYLYLLRHADSTEKKTGERDQDRALSDTGVSQARIIANYLRENKFRVDQIVCSSATRTRATSALVNEALQLPTKNILIRDDLYEASANDLVRVIDSLDDTFHYIMIVGHNPGMSWLTGYLSGKNPIPMSTAALVVMKFDSTSWHEIMEGSGNIFLVTDPQSLKRPA